MAVPCSDVVQGKVWELPRSPAAYISISISSILLHFTNIAFQHVEVFTVDLCLSLRQDRALGGSSSLSAKRIDGCACIILFPFVFILLVPSLRSLTTIRLCIDTAEVSMNIDSVVIPNAVGVESAAQLLYTQEVPHKRRAASAAVKRLHKVSGLNRVWGGQTS